MVRKLTEQDRNRTLEFLSEEPAINLFVIGDIESFGFDKDFQELWGSFNETSQMNGVLLRYNENFIPYYKDGNFDTTEFVKIINEYKERKMITGKKSVVDNFEDVIKEANKKSSYFCELRNGDLLKGAGNDIKIANVDDAERVYNLLEEIEEFQMTDTNSVERIQRVLKTKVGRIYYIENEKKEMITVAQTTAENSKSAMVVGIATKKGYRKKGYMSRCLSKLCMDVLQDGKTLCLFYDNPEAGSVYHRLGFRSIDNWKMIIEKK